jgi:uncharacterized delta-60 repeat protein
MKNVRNEIPDPSSGSTWGARLRGLGAAGVVTLALPAGAAAAATGGDLDPSFGGDGKVILPFNGHPEATLVQPDGKIVLVGSYPGSDFTVRRLNPDGSLDNSFDGDGTAVADLGADDQAHAAALQPDGGIVVAGTSSTPAAHQGAVARFDGHGTLDDTFDPGGGDGDGTKLLPSLTSAAAVVVQDDGRIVVSGYYADHFETVRLGAKGAPDGTSFGPAVVDGATSEFVNAAALAPDRRIVLAGTIRAGGPRAAIAVYNADGTLDKGFAGTGIVALPADVLSSATAVAVQPDGAIVAAGASNPVDLRMAVVRLDDEGELDDAFGNGGKATADFEGQDFVVGAALAPDGRILLAGNTDDQSVLPAARLSSGGLLDSSFGSGGRTTFAFDALNLACSAAVQPDGKFVVAGQTAVDGTVARMAVARLLADPPPDGGTSGPDTGADQDGGGGGSPRDLVPPELSGLRVVPARFGLGSGLPRTLTASAAGARARIRFGLSEQASVRFTFRRARRGVFRKVRGSFTVHATAGTGRVRFAGRLTNRRHLAPGRYRLIATPVDAVGNVGRRRRATFTLLARTTGASAGQTTRSSR